MDFAVPQTLEEWNLAGAEYLPGFLGIKIEAISPEQAVLSLELRSAVMSWNGFLHGGTVVALADTCCGYGTVKSLPEGATGFTTLELKSNFISTARDGVVRCIGKPVHKGRTTQVWDARVEHGQTGKLMAEFRCTQMILWPKASS